MGKASSSKKVARAARAGGGRRPGQRRHLAYPLTIVAIIIAGVALVAFARSEREASAQPTTEDHWHAAYGVYVCDSFLPPLSDAGPDTLGIHTHDEGVIHIHPFLDSAAGTKATLGKFFQMVGLSIDNSTMTLPDGTSFEEGTDTCGEGDDAEEGRLVVARWANADEAEEGKEPSELITDGFGGTRFRSDREAYTIAFVPPGTDIPPPESIPRLDNLSDVPSDDTETDSDTDTPTSTEPETDTTEPTETTDTAPDDTSTTTAP